MFVLVYIDDIIVISSLDQAISALLHNLVENLSIKDLGDINYFLGIY